MARPLLAELTQAHLADQPAPERYVLHDLLRAYATELASTVDTPEEQDAATRRLIDHYLHTTQGADRLLSPHRRTSTTDDPAPGVTLDTLGDRNEASAWLTLEHATIVAIIDLAAAGRYQEHAIRLAAAVAEFLNRRGHWHDWAATQRTALAAATRLGDRPAQAGIHHALGLTHLKLGRRDDAYTEMSRALDLHTELRNPIGQAAAHRGLGDLLKPSLAALDHGEQALALYRAAGDEDGEGIALNALGYCDALLGDHQRAIQYCGEALTILQRIGNRRGEAATWDSLGYAHHHLGNHREAITCYQRAAQLCHATGDRYLEAFALTGLGQAHKHFGDQDAARATWHQALTILTDLDHPDADDVRARLTALTKNPTP